jgi:hypothetical protein
VIRYPQKQATLHPPWISLTSHSFTGLNVCINLCLKATSKIAADGDNKSILLLRWRSMKHVNPVFELSLADKTLVLYWLLQKLHCSLQTKKESMHLGEWTGTVRRNENMQHGVTKCCKDECCITLYLRDVTRISSQYSVKPRHWFGFLHSEAALSAGVLPAWLWGEVTGTYSAQPVSDCVPLWLAPL